MGRALLHQMRLPGKTMKQVTVHTYRQDPYYPRVVRAVANILARADVVAPVHSRANTIIGATLAQDLAATIRSQRLRDRVLALVERVHTLHGDRERSIRDEVAQPLVPLLDRCAGRAA